MSQQSGLRRCADCEHVRAAWSVKNGVCAPCRGATFA